MTYYPLKAPPHNTFKLPVKFQHEFWTDKNIILSVTQKKEGCSSCLIFKVLPLAPRPFRQSFKTTVWTKPCFLLSRTPRPGDDMSCSRSYNQLEEEVRWEPRLSLFPVPTSPCCLPRTVAHVGEEHTLQSDYRSSSPGSWTLLAMI